MIPDVNILIAAYRRDHPHHKNAAPWLESAQRHTAEGRATFILLPSIIAGFLRIVTHTRIFPQPDTMGEAMKFIDALIATPGVEIRAEFPWTLFRNKLLQTKPQLNVTDIWIAATVEALSEHLVTLDHDFKNLLSHADVTFLR